MIDPTMTQAAQQKERDEKLWQAMLTIAPTFIAAALNPATERTALSIDPDAVAERMVCSWERATGRRQ
jgi:hypothetical protein